MFLKKTKGIEKEKKTKKTVLSLALLYSLCLLLNSFLVNKHRRKENLFYDVSIGEMEIYFYSLFLFISDDDLKNKTS